MSKTIEKRTISILFHNNTKDNKIIEKALKNFHGGEIILIVASDPEGLPHMLIEPSERIDELCISEFDLYTIAILDASRIHSSNELFIDLRNSITKLETRFHLKASLDVDLECADQIQSFMSARLSAIYDCHIHIGDSDMKVQSLPGHVDLNDRERDLLLFYYENHKLFSKTEVLEDFEEFNSNKYQASKDKLERNGLIMLTLPPVDRQVRSGKNPDYFKVTINGFYMALLNKINKQTPEKDNSDDYYFYTKIDKNSLKERGKMSLDSKKLETFVYKMDLSRDPYKNFD